MKKATRLLSAALMLTVAIVPVTLQQTAVAEPDYSVDGGRLTIDFENKNDYQQFTLLTEFDKQPYQMDGALYFWTLCEQKAILSEKQYGDVEVNVDISTINECGKFDSGVYVAASGANGSINGITAWNVNLEHGASQSTMQLKLHRFEKGSWKGAIVEIGSIPYTKDCVHLRVVVKGGVLYAFLNNNSKPTFSYEIGETVGQVGLRNFYSPNYFDNFTVTGIGNEVDRSELKEAVELAQETIKKTLAQESSNELNVALALAESANTQSETDAALKALLAALERAVTAHTYAELTSLVSQADEILNPNGDVYTANSWNSFLAVKAICKTITEDSSEYDISYWYDRLLARKEGLIAYITEDAQ